MTSEFDDLEKGVTMSYQRPFYDNTGRSPMAASMYLIKSRHALWFLSLVFIAVLLAVTAGVVAGDYKEHDPILIDGDGNFTSGNGVVSGNGSAGNPYVIKGWEISCSTKDSIKVVNTRKHVVISDIHFNNTKGSSGNRIHLENVTNVTIERILVNQPGDPFYIEESENITIRNLTSYYHSWITVTHCKHINLIDIDISRIRGRFYIHCSDLVKIIHCRTSNDTQAGYRLENSERVQVNNCTTEGNSAGVSTSGCTNCTISRCTFMNSTSSEASIFGKGHKLRNNRMGNKSIYIELSGYHDIDQSNTMDGIPLQYYLNKTGLILNQDLTQIFLVGCRDCIIENLTYSQIGTAISLYGVENCIVRNITASSVRSGLYVGYANKCIFCDFSVNIARGGITAEWSDNCIFEGFYIKTDPMGSSSDPYDAVDFDHMGNVTFRNSIVTGTYRTGISISHQQPAFKIFHMVNVTVLGEKKDGGLVQNGVRHDYGGNVSLDDCYIYNHSGNGFITVDCWSASVRNCTILDTDGVGIQYARTNFVEIRSNIVKNHRVGIAVKDTIEGIIEGNVVENCTWYGVGNSIATAMTRWTIFVNNTVSRVQGFAFSIRGNSTVTNNTVLGCKSGFSMNGKNISLSNCRISNCSMYGIETSGVTNGTIHGCHIENVSSISLWVRWTRGYRIWNNTIIKGRIGIQVEDSSNCTFWHNNITDHLDWAFMCSDNVDNVVHHNLLFRNNYDGDTGKYNGPQAVSDQGTEFDNGHDGNYWSDYQLRYPNAKVVDRHWDTPYAIASGNVWDDYPMVYTMNLVPPIAIAGENQTVYQSDTVTFNGSQSSDDIGVIDFHWTFFYNGSTVNLSGAVVVFTFDIPGVYEVKLTVLDGWGNQGVDTVHITVIDNVPPVASAGEDLTVNVGEVFALNASASWDIGGIVEYRWTVDPEGLNITLLGEVVQLSLNSTGQYQVVLKVTDAFGNWATDDLVITVVDTLPPLANAGKDLTIEQGMTLYLNGSASTDNLGIADWCWTLEYDGKAVELHGETSSFTFEIPGVYVVVLEVTDLSGHKAKDSVTITVLDSAGPIARAGDDIEVNEGTEVQFDGSGSTDNVGIVSYVWTFIYQGLEKVLYGVKSSFVFDTPGVYLVKLSVADGTGKTDEAMINVTVRDITPPLVHIRMEAFVDQGTEVILDGTGSSDNVGIISYRWTFIDDGTPVELSEAYSTYIFEVPGEYEITLALEDGSGNSASRMEVLRVRDTEAPRAIAGENKTIIEGDDVVFSASASTDNVGIVRFQWEIVHAGTSRTEEGMTLELRSLEVGEYIVILSVHDEAGNHGEDTVTVTVLPWRTPWRLGPFADREGEPVEGVNVSIVLNGKSYKAVTSDDGWTEVMVDRFDLVSPAEVWATKEGWKSLTFSLILDEEGNPVGEIPPLEKKAEPSSEPSGSTTVLAAVIIIGLIVLGIALLWWKKRY